MKKIKLNKFELLEFADEISSVLDIDQASKIKGGYLEEPYYETYAESTYGDTIKG